MNVNEMGEEETLKYHEQLCSKRRELQNERAQAEYELQMTEIKLAISKKKVVMLEEAIRLRQIREYNEKTIPSAGK